MSGGSYDYFTYKLSHFAVELKRGAEGKEEPQRSLRLRFADHMEAAAKAAYAIEWVDSFDMGPGDEIADLEAYFALNAGQIAPKTTYIEQAHYRCPEAEVALVGRVGADGVRIGCQALEPWYGAGVLIPQSHPAYAAAVAFLAALAEVAPDKN